MKFILCIVVVSFLAGVVAAPAFLLYEHPLKEADCIVVMFGGKFTERRHEAVSLIENGVGRVLLLPAWRKVVFYNRAGGKKKQGTLVVSGRPQVNRKIFGKHLDLYENTHLELILAREMMDELKLKSAVVVSSPYHMRRLRMIAGRVFAGKYRIGFKASAEPYGVVESWRSPCFWKYVGSEYMKIAWFLIYSRFV